MPGAAPRSMLGEIGGQFGFATELSRQKQGFCSNLRALRPYS
jgi:hypothetical protein